MATKALKGSAATMLSVSSLSEATRAVTYTEATATAQPPKNKQIADALAIMDRLISARSTRGLTSIVTNPSPDS